MISLCSVSHHIEINVNFLPQMRQEHIEKIHEKYCELKCDDFQLSLLFA